MKAFNALEDTADQKKRMELIASQIHPEIDVDQQKFMMGLLLHPIRYRVARAIKDEFMCTTQIVDKLGTDKHDTSFYLTDLSRFELTDGVFREVVKATKTKKGTAAKFYKLNDEGRRILHLVTRCARDINSVEIENVFTSKEASRILTKWLKANADASTFR